ncbi:MAG: HAD family phosphatase [Rikenellaceae bacterium]|nr:HAD family phosphatase [Rikenellaceae bacterium]
MVKNIIFDLGGVLLDLDRQRVIDAYDKMGFTQADQLLNNFLQKGIFMELERGTASRWELYDHIRQSTGKSIPAWKIDDALNNFIVGLAPYKLDMLRRLRKDFRLYVLSNTNEIMIPEIDRVWFGQQGMKMADYFDRMFFSYEMKLLKPDPEIFERLALQAGISPQESLFLDDGPQNVEAGAAAGNRVYRPEPDEDLKKALVTELGLPGDYFD